MGNRRSAPTVLVVLVTCPSLAVGRRLATALVTRHLAACVNLVPRVESLFWWKAKMERCRETLLIMKTTRARFASLKQAVIRLHPYDVPEVLALTVSDGHRPYLAWVEGAVTLGKRL